MNFEDLKDLPPCTAIPLLMFLEDEHRDLVLGMTGIPRTLLIDFTSKVNRLAHGYIHKIVAKCWVTYDVKKCQPTLKVDTSEELQALIDNLLRRQLIFQCALHHERKEGSTLRVWNESFAVIINPWHPAIKEFLQPLLTETMDHLNAGEKFCLKIKFGKSLKDWFRETIGDDLECKQGRTTLSGMGLYIYNYSTPVEVCSNPELIISCFPFWFLFGGSCYMMQRKIRFYDRREKLSGIPISVVRNTAEYISTIESCVQITGRSNAVAPINE